MLKPRHRLGHQPRVLVQIPVGIVEVRVPEISGQRQQAPFRIGASAVASLQNVNSHGMPQIVQAWPVRRSSIAHPDPSCQPFERPAQSRVDDPAPRLRDEEGQNLPTGKVRCARVPIGLQNDLNRPVNPGGYLVGVMQR